MARGGLKRLIAALDRNVPEAVVQGARLIEDRAKGLIMEGSVSGSGHVTSAPGEAPNNDLGDLIRGIEHHHPEPLRAQVISQSQAAASLEWGTSRMRERPYMRPAAMTEERNVAKLIGQAVNSSIKKAGGS